MPFSSNSLARQAMLHNGAMIDQLMAGCIIKSRECGGQGVWWVATRNGSVTEFSLRGGLTGKDLERIS